METQLQRDLVHDKSLVFINQQSLSDKYIWDPWTKKSLTYKSQVNNEVDLEHATQNTLPPTTHSIARLDLAIFTQLILFVASLLCTTSGIQSIIEESRQKVQDSSNSNSQFSVSLSLQFPFLVGIILFSISFLILLILSVNKRPKLSLGEADNRREIELVRTMEEVYQDEDLQIGDAAQTSDHPHHANNNNNNNQQFVQQPGQQVNQDNQSRNASIQIDITQNTNNSNNNSNNVNGNNNSQNNDGEQQDIQLSGSQDLRDSINEVNVSQQQQQQQQQQQSQQQQIVQQQNFDGVPQQDTNVPPFRQQGDRDIVVVHGREMELESPVDPFEFDVVQELQNIIGSRQQSDPNSSTNDQSNMSSSPHVYDDQNSRRESNDVNANFQQEIIAQDLNLSDQRQNVEQNSILRQNYNEIQNQNQNFETQDQNVESVRGEFEAQNLNEESQPQNFDQNLYIQEQQRNSINSKTRWVLDFAGTCMFLLGSFSFGVASFSIFITTIQQNYYNYYNNISSLLLWVPFLTGSLFFLLGNILYISTGIIFYKDVRVPIFSGLWWMEIFQFFGGLGIFLGTFICVGIGNFSQIDYLSLVQWTFLGFFLVAVGSLIGLLRLFTMSRRLNS